MPTSRMRNEGSYPVIDDELVRLKAEALDAGHLKLATWGTKEDLIRFRDEGVDRLRYSCLQLLTR